VLSPDGTRLAFAAESADQQTRLWVREVASGRLTMLAGSEGPQYPFWSPDGRWIAYFTQITGLLRKIPSAGGAPLTLCPAQNGKGGSWNEQDVIVFAPGPGTPIYRISAAGGTPVAATELDAARFNSHRHPRFLPDGRHFLFLARSAAGEGSRVLFGSLDGGPPRDLMRSATQAEWADGHLLFVRDGALLAQAFDPAAGILSGEPMPVADEVIASSNAAVAMFSASSNGLLAFHSGEAEGRAPLEWRDRTGASLGTLGEPADYRNPAFSPDGRQVAFARTPQAGANPDIWIRDLDSGLETRFTLGAGEDIFPTWTADGRSLIYCSNANGPHALYRKSLVGSGEAELLYASSEASFPSSISPDGRWLLFRSSSETGNLDIWLLDVETRQAKPWRAGPAIESWTDFSPDGRWVLYTSDESDRLEIYAVPFPGPGRVLQVSSAGGVLPKWRADGREIIYTNLAGEVIALPVESAGDGLRIGAGTKLFTVPVPNLFDRPIVPTPLADRFLVVPSGVGAARNELNLLVNWTARLPPRRPS
jgi:Tol biopolymer transport system component